METGKIKTLFSDKGKTEALFPRTKVSAISDDNSVGLDVLLEDKASKYFVTNKIAEAQMSGGSGEDIDLSGYATKDDLLQKADSSHNHNASDITSGILPIARGGTGATTAADALIKLGINATADELNYLDGATSNVQDQINKMQSKIDSSVLNQIPVVDTSGSGEAYTATVPGITGLTKGEHFFIKPHTVSTTVKPTLSVNGKAAKPLKRIGSSKTNTYVDGATADWIGANIVLVVYSGSYWIVIGQTKPTASDLSGTVSVDKGGTGRATLTSGSYLVGNSTSAVALKTPSEVRENIGAASSEEFAILAESVNNLETEVANKEQLEPIFVNSTEECTDIGKVYVLPDGNIYAYMNTKVSGYTNQIPISTDADGKIYNNTGYKEATRISGSDGVTESETEGTNPVFTTGFIPVVYGDTIRLGNCFIIAKYDISVDIYGSSGYGCALNLYDKHKRFIGCVRWSQLESAEENTKFSCNANADYIVTELQVIDNSFAYVRLTLAANDYANDAIVTVNEVIDGNHEVTYEFRWTNTGHAFIPADYEDRIITLEKSVSTLNKAMSGDMPIYGIVDSSNTIILTGTLADGAYTLKYLNKDGTETEIGSFLAN